VKKNIKHYSHRQEVARKLNLEMLIPKPCQKRRLLMLKDCKIERGSVARKDDPNALQKLQFKNECRPLN
jgi:hypothetical protein